MFMSYKCRYNKGTLNVLRIELRALKQFKCPFDAHTTGTSGVNLCCQRGKNDFYLSSG